MSEQFSDAAKAGATRLRNKAEQNIAREHDGRTERHSDACEGCRILGLMAEIERLRTERDSWQRRAGDLYDEWNQQAHVANGLRALINDAPHMESCQMSYLSSYPKARCTCWKVEAL